MSTVTKLLILGVAALLLIGALAGALYDLGRKTEQANAVKQAAGATAQAQVAANIKTRADLARAQATGKAREQRRAKVDADFNHLDREGRDAPSSAADSYVLPDDRLRIWRAANAGGHDPDAATCQPHHPAAGATATAQWADSGSGGEPSGCGAGLSPVGDAALSSADVSADTTGGL